MTREDDGGDDEPLVARLRDAFSEHDVEHAANRLRAALLAGLFGTGGPPRLGRYTTGPLLGQGGAGAVYRAHDGELDRAVAIKVLRVTALDDETDDEHAGVGARGRLLREAQALARIEHPNVVRIFDVGMQRDDDGRVSLYLVMELVEGTSVQAWLRTLPGWRAVVAGHVDAARGLAAAHARGVVHRDFKPANAIRDRMGRVRVLDFGLAIGDAVASPAIAADGPDMMWSSSLTRSDFVVGTPPYMAPEQHARGTIDHRADQYSLCVSLYEGLYGARPFVQTDLAAMVAAKRRAMIPAPPRSAVPAAVFEVVCRGLAPRPDDRFSSMAALADALEATLRPRWPSRLAKASGVAALVIAGGFAWSTWRASARCEDERAALAGGEVARIEAAFEQTGVPYATWAAPRVVARLSEHRAAVDELWREACRARRGDMIALAPIRRCLERRRDEREALVEQLELADRQVVVAAILASHGLGAPAECERPDGGGDDEPFAAGHEQLARERTRMRQMAAAGRRDAAREAAASLVEQARALDDPRALVRVLIDHGELELAGGDGPRGAAAIEEAAHLAAAVGDDVSSAHAWLRIAQWHGQRGRIDDAQTALRHAEAVAATLEPDPDRERLLLGVHEALALAQGEAVEAVRLAEQVRALTLEMYGEGDPRARTADNDVAVGLRRAGRLDEAIALLEDSIRALSESLGPDHPDLALTHATLGSALYDRGDFRGALEHDERASAILEGVGESRSRRRAAIESHLAGALLGLGQAETARERAAAALDQLASLGELDTTTATVARNNLAIALSELGDSDGAIAQLQAALATHMRVNPRGRSVPLAHGNLARELAGIGRDREALEHAALAVSISSDVFGARSLEAAIAHHARGEVELALGQAPQAIASLERARELRRALGAPGHVLARTELALAGARLANGEPEAALVEELAEVRRRLVDGGVDDPRLLADLERWPRAADGG